MILQGLLKSTGDITDPNAEDIIKQGLNIIAVRYNHALIRA